MLDALLNGQKNYVQWPKNYVQWPKNYVQWPKELCAAAAKNYVQRPQRTMCSGRKNYGSDRKQFLLVFKNTSRCLSLLFSYWLAEPAINENQRTDSI